MKVTTVHKTRIAVGISVVVALTLGGWLLSATAGAAKTAAPRVAYATGAMSGSDRASKLTAQAQNATTVLEPGTILNDRFVKSFKLSNGALTLETVFPVSSLLRDAIVPPVVMPDVTEPHTAAAIAAIDKPDRSASTLLILLTIACRTVRPSVSSMICDSTWLAIEPRSPTVSV